jgi:hypothetical protein
MSVGDDRIRLEVVPGSPRGPDMQAVFIGHCPGQVSREALASDEALASTLLAMGYHERVASWQAAVASPALPGDELYDLALPIRSLAQLQRLFPEIQLADAERVDESGAWLPWAVQDSFAAGRGRGDGRLCWVIRVPEATSVSDSLAAFDARAGAVRHEPASWGPGELASSLDDAGLLVMPDLERLLVPPPESEDIARKRLPNPSPDFYPCGTRLDDGHRERRYSNEMPEPGAILQSVRRIRDIANRLHAWRPDMQWLLALSADSEYGLPLPRPRASLLSWLQGIEQQGSPAMAQVQLLFPLVYGEHRPLTSPGGLIAGHIVHRTARDGVWRSVAGTPLSDRLRPWPELSRAARAGLREDPGLGVLHLTPNGALQLDDERLVASGFCDAAGTACRSGELMRFVGWLRRSLRRLGEGIVFTLDGRDPAIANMLDAFLNGLHRKGALRGASADQAYRVTRVGNRSDLVQYRIEIAPSFPVDAFVVTFLHERNANSPRWLWEQSTHA